ncbi:MAG: retropepsin-like aspartic protease [Halieaceae bacterium]|nr:retropepsin-like aspartic protease [Halieaceae bacterium]
MQLNTPAVVRVTVIACLGFAAGWFSHDVFRDTERAADAVTIDAQVETSEPLAAAVPLADTTEAVLNDVSDEQHLGQLLSQQRFQEATTFYYEGVRLDPLKAQMLRPKIDDYMQRCSETCDGAIFLALVETWLATFYDDIPVLLLLARYQEKQGQPEGAANTLLLARTYAFTVADQRAVDSSLGQLARGTDERLSAEQRWIELLGFYEYLVAIDFTTPEFELRRALLYGRIGEQSRGSELLARLRAADDGSDPQWSAALQQHLSDADTEMAPGAVLSNAVPLERRGAGYIVEVTLNDQATLKLLVDTGASMTALTHESFRRLQRHRFSLLGTRLFNTANGYTRGDIYRASALTLGEERIEGASIAVLDLRTMDDIDGLLGMNVLRHFHFEIDQSAGVMKISRR